MECPAIVPELRYQRIATALELVPEVKAAEERVRKETFEDAIYEKKRAFEESQRTSAERAQVEFKALLAAIPGN